MFDVPTEENAGDGGEAGEQHEYAADAVGGEQEVDAHGGDPGNVDDDWAAWAHACGETTDGVQEGQHSDGKREPARQTGLAFRQEGLDERPGKREIDRPRQHLKSPVSQQVNDRWVHAVHNNLGHKADDQHQADNWDHGQSLAVVQIRKADAMLGHGAGKYFLNDGEDDSRGDQQAEDGNRSRNPGQRKDAAEDQEFADEAVKAGQAERREEHDAHKSGEHGGWLADAAELVDAAMAIGALLQHGDKPEERGRGDAVIEHLQDDAVERGGLAGLRGSSGGGNSEREDAEQTIAEVIDRGVREDALEVGLCSGGPCAHALKHTHGRYAAYFNARHVSSGHVWQGRYYSCPLDTPHFCAALRYTELNPVRAGMVEDPVDYPWSSAAAHCGCGAPDPWLEMKPFSDAWDPALWREYLSQAGAVEEADAIRKSTHSGRPLGTPDFVAQLEKALRRRLAPLKGGRPPKEQLDERQTSFIFRAG